MRVLKDLKEKFNFRKDEEETKGILIKIILILTFFLFLGFGFFHLAKFVTADEHYWIYERVPQYWKSIEEHRFKKMLINDKPGITVALTSGAGLLFEKDPEKHKEKIDKSLTHYDTARSQSLYLAYRLPILLFSGLFLFFFFWIIGKITNRWVALWSTIFIGLSPVLVGISQIINPDSLLWLFFMAAIFSYSAFLKKQKFKYLFLTAIFTGLAMLSKYTANILFPFYLFMLGLYYVIEIKNISRESAYAYFKLNIFSFLAIIGGAVLVIFLFLPAILVKPVYLYRLTIGFSETRLLLWLVLGAFSFLLLDTFFLKNFLLINIKKFFSRYSFIFKLPAVIMFILVIVLIVGRNFYPSWQLFEIIPFDIKNLSDIGRLNIFPSFAEKILLELNTFVFSVTPIVLFLTLFVWFKYIAKKTVRFRFYIVSLSSFMIIYVIASIKADVLNTIRYNIILYPLASFLAAMGLYELTRFFSKKLKVYVLVSICIVIVSSVNLFWVKPYYFNYTNILLPKDKIIVGAWGYGGYEAAEYLNGLSNAENITIWADYYGVCEFFKGKCITNYEIDLEKYSIDYYVVTRRGGIRYLPSNDLRSGSVKAWKYYSKENPVWQLNINNREKNYVKIFKSDTLKNEAE